MAKAFSIYKKCLFLLGITSCSAVAHAEMEEIFMGSVRYEGSHVVSQHDNVQQMNPSQQIGDVLLYLRKDKLFSIRLNTASDAPTALISKETIPAKTGAEFVEHVGILATKELVMVFSRYQLDEEDITELRFYNLSKNGALHFKERYLFTALESGFSEFVFGMTLVGDKLVSSVSAYTHDDINEDLIKDNKLLAIDAKRQAASDTSSETHDIIKSYKYANSLSSLEVLGRYYVGIFNCPINSVLKGGLDCHVTMVLGIDSTPFYISHDAVYLRNNYIINNGEDKYGTVALDKKDYLARNDLDVVFDDSGEYATYEYYSAFYRVGLEHNEVTAALYEGNLVNPWTYIAENGALTALLKKKTNAGDRALYGLNFSLDKFSTRPTHLADEHYHYLLSDKGSISVNQFKNEQAIIARSNGSYTEKTIQHELIVWHTEKNESSVIQNDLGIDKLFYQEDKLVSVSLVDDTPTLSVWSTEQDIERLFNKRYDQYRFDLPRNKDFIIKNPQNGNFLWGLPIFDETKQTNASEPTSSNSSDVIGIAYFETTPDGILLEVEQHKLVDSSADDDCQSSCYLNYGLEAYFNGGDYVYTLLENQLIKSVHTAEGLEFLHRLHLLDAKP